MWYEKFEKMGMYDIVVGIVNRWKGKRKRDEEEDEEESPESKKVRTYKFFVGLIVHGKFLSEINISGFTPQIKNEVFY